VSSSAAALAWYKVAALPQFGSPTSRGPVDAGPQGGAQGERPDLTRAAGPRPGHPWLKPRDCDWSSGRLRDPHGTPDRTIYYSAGAGRTARTGWSRQRRVFGSGTASDRLLRACFPRAGRPGAVAGRGGLRDGHPGSARAWAGRGSARWEAGQARDLVVRTAELPGVPPGHYRCRTCCAAAAPVRAHGPGRRAGWSASGHFDRVDEHDVITRAARTRADRLASQNRDPAERSCRCGPRPTVAAYADRPNPAPKEGSLAQMRRCCSPWSWDVWTRRRRPSYRRPPTDPSARLYLPRRLCTGRPPRVEARVPWPGRA